MTPPPVAGGTQLITETRYDAVGNRTVQIDAKGQVTTYLYDVRDGLFQVKESPNAWTDPLSPPAGVITTEYSYDTAGNLMRMTRAKGDAANERVTDYAYDGRALVRRETQYPSWPATTPTLVTTSAYDPNGNRTTLVDPLARTTTSVYDRLNRLTTTDYSDPATPDVTYVDDANGNRTSMLDGTGTTTYVYDEANRLTSVTSPGPKTVAYRYDLDGNRTKLIYPDATAVAYTFNKASQLASLQDWASHSTSYTYWPDGALKATTNPDASVATYAYDNDRRVTDILNQAGATTIGHFAYTLDPVGNVTGLTDGDGPATRTVSSAGALSNGTSDTASMSADGRYVAFDSAASNLVSGDTNAAVDVFIQDQQSGTMSRISVASAGTEAVGASSSPSASGDGRYVAFASDATNLVAGDTNGTTDIFIRDRQTATTSRVSVTSAGVQATGSSTDPSISADGRYVAFTSAASNLVSGDTNAIPDVFVRDLQAGTTVRVSVATSGAQATGPSSSPSISADGHVVAFISTAANLVTGDTNATTDVFIRNLQTSTTTRVSVATGGAQANGISVDPSINADGHFVAFSSAGTNLVAGDSNGIQDVFLRDVQAGSTSQVSVPSSFAGPVPPPQAASGSGSPSISSDGRYVAFDSSDNTLVFGDTNAARDVFVRDAQAATTSRASVATSGTQSNANSVAPAIRGDGSVVAFSSDASNLVSGDTNALSDVFVRVQSAGPLQNTYGYDRLSRLTTASGPDGARTYTYDPAGNRASVASSGSTTYSYDRADRILSLQAPPTTGSSTRPPSTNDAGWTSGANAYVSDNLYATAAPAKNITTAIKVGTFGFDSAVPSNATITGVTVTVEWKVSTTASIATLGAQAYVSGVAVGTELVNAAEPTSDTTQSFTVPGLTRTQLLNAVFQVRVRATRGNSATAFTASLDVVSVKVDYTVPTTVAMASDADGNTTAKGADTFTFDQPNRLKSATVAGATETYAYDGDGVRFSRTVGLNPAIRYVSDVNTSLPVTLDDGTRKYVYGLGLAYDVSGSTIEVYHTDRLGSVRAITDATGAVTSTYRTDEYGGLTATTGSSTQPFGFTGEPHDATTLTYLRARYYDPSLGRFMTRDTWAGSSKSPDSLNRFAYAEDNPLSRVDHSGRATSRVLTNVAGLGVLMVGGAICVWSGACEVAAVVVAADALATGALEIATPAEEVATAAAIDASQAQQIIQNGVRVGSALQTDLFHTIPDQYVAQIARNGSVFRLLGDDGQVRTLVQMSVTLTSGRAGRVEWIVDAAGEITHQFFIADGAVNGVPIKP